MKSYLYRSNNYWVSDTVENELASITFRGATIIELSSITCTGDTFLVR